MENVEIKKEEDKKIKKDFHPLWIYLVFQLAVPIALGIIIGIVGTIITGKEPDIQTVTDLITIISLFGLFLVLFIMYFKKIKTETKRLTKKQIIFIVIAFVVITGLNAIITTIMEKLNVNMDNQDIVSNLVSTYAIPSIILLTVLMPLAEEIVFRYSLGSLIKNNIVFIIVSSILFGIFHGIGVVTLLYIFLGVAFGIVYLKTDKNFMASFFVHLLNNIVGVLLILIF